MAFTIIVLSCLLALANAGPFVREPLIRPTLSVRMPKISSRVVGGAEANVGEFPHQVSLQYGEYGSKQLKHFCGGSIINETWVVTAGHCVNAIIGTGTRFVVKAGKHNIALKEATEQVVDVIDTIVHQDYPGDVAPFDIALLKLKKPLVFNEWVQPIALPSQGAEPTGEVILSGWGSVSTNQWTVLPKTLHTVVLPIIDHDTCNDAIVEMSHGYESPLHETNVCTGPLSGGLGACRGDSGGPLISRQADGESELVGVVSWGFVPCGAVGAPSVFVKVADFVDWILEAVAENSSY